MDKYTGEERRVHCLNHEQNTADITTLKTKATVMTWLLGGLGTFSLFVAGVLITILTNISDKIDKTSNITIETKAEVKYLASNLDTHLRSEPERRR